MFGPAAPGSAMSKVANLVRRSKINGPCVLILTSSFCFCAWTGRLAVAVVREEADAVLELAFTVGDVLPLERKLDPASTDKCISTFRRITMRSTFVDGPTRDLPAAGCGCPAAGGGKR